MHADGIVKIACIGTIDGHKGDMAQIGALRPLPGIDLGGKLRRLMQDGIGKGFR